MFGIFIFITVTSCAYSYKTTSQLNPWKNINFEILRSPKDVSKSKFRGDVKHRSKMDDYSITLPDYALNELFFSINKDQFEIFRSPKDVVNSNENKIIAQTEINPTSEIITPREIKILEYDISLSCFVISLYIFLFSIFDGARRAQ